MMKLNFLIFVVIFLFSLINCDETSIKEIKTEHINPNIETKKSVIETSEEKAVRLAEEFIKRNGYTDAPADKDNLAHETIEFYNSIDELLERRKNSLETKAFGVSAHGRGNEKGWTVVFQYTEKVIKEFEKIPKTNLVGNPKLAGRAVTMNEKFENLLVNHKDFVLEKVEKKLQ